MNAVPIQNSRVTLCVIVCVVYYATHIYVPGIYLRGTYMVSVFQFFAVQYSSPETQMSTIMSRSSPKAHLPSLSNSSAESPGNC
jgi:hypothetical protein